MKERTPRQKAILRRRIFLSCCAAVLVIVIVGVSLVISAITKAIKGPKTEGGKTDSSVSDVVSSEDLGSADNSSSEASKTSSASSVKVNLDPNYSNLLLVNADNPLPDDYDSNVQKDLVEIDAKYRNNNNVTKIHKDIYPYITAMVAAAQAEGVDLRVWSPFRSYAIQKDLFQKQVNRVGGDEAKAATVVARPGTSEHNTGLCADFNMADDAFENTRMYTWMTKNAENYGFVMRYSKEKKPITGVIHESWHWRFVGINAAKEMNKLGMCLEEYVEYKK